MVMSDSGSSIQAPGRLSQHTHQGGTLFVRNAFLVLWFLIGLQVVWQNDLISVDSVRIIGLFFWPTGVLCAQPKLLETLAVLTGKGTCISHHASSHQGVTRQKIIFFSEGLDLAGRWLWTFQSLEVRLFESKARSETSDPFHHQGHQWACWHCQAWDITTAESTVGISKNSKNMHKPFSCFHVSKLNSIL